MAAKRALITGITGQDGSYLAELLLEKGYEVHGIIRRSSSFNTGRIMHVFQDPHVPKPRLQLHYGDLTDGSNLNRLIEKIEPHEIYHLAAQSHVRVSFDIPEYTGDVTGLGCLRLLDAIRETQVKTRFYQASSSEMFGASPPPQSERTPFQPRSPYACAKLYGYHLTINYREAYGLFACNGILFNHESPRRGETFVTRKIARAVARIKAGLDKKLYLGNLKAKRDWGYAPEYVDAMWRMLQQPKPDDYVEGMWMILQQDKPDDYVLATGETHSVREFVELAFDHVGRRIEWEGAGEQEQGRCARTGDVLVAVDPRYFRPTEVNHLRGDASKARRVLKWRPKVAFDELVRIMVDAELQQAGLVK